MVTLPTTSQLSQIEWDAEKLTGSYSGQVDDFGSEVWLTLDVTAGKNYYLYAQSFAFYLNEPWVQVYNSAGELITEARYSGLAALTLSPTATGRLYIALKNTSGYPGMMDFSVTDTPATTSFDDDANTDDNRYTGTFGERIFGFWGDDIIQIGNGADASGGRGDDYIVGNDFANRIWGDHGEDTLNGQGGNDRIWGGTGQDDISGGAGDDQLFGGDDFDGISGGADNDRLVGGAGGDLLNGDAGSDSLNGGTGNDQMRGGSGDDTYVVDSVGDSVIENAAEGTDTVRTSVSYTLTDNVENAALLGSGNLNATGNAASNRLTGNSGNNRLDGKAGADTLIGGGGNDTYVIDNAGDIVSEAAGGGTDLVQTSVGWAMSANVENVSVIGGAIINVRGNALHNTITGNAANNILSGEGGNDILSGGNGNDRLVGGAGNDKLTGGVGSDVFLFDSAPNASTNMDTIVDFNVAADTIWLDNAIFLGLAAGQLTSTMFKDVALGTKDSNDRILYDSDTGNLFFDRDGTGTTYAAVRFASLSGSPTLTAADFFVI